MSEDKSPYQKSTVVLIGYQDQGNLGLGYLASVLQRKDYTVEIIDFKVGEHAILNSIKEHNPLLVGFSLIFQYYLPQFAKMLYFLRANNIDCHFTVGGHYPSLRYREILIEIAALDSVVLFEGEYTLLDLVESISNNMSWKNVYGIAYRENDKIIQTPLRPLSNLDQLPYPYRPFEDQRILGEIYVPILASRGCHHKCSFCSIRKFYGGAGGRIVRRRDPNLVVQEMKELHEKSAATIFLFQDDDFPLIGKGGKRWTYKFIKALHDNELVGKVIWKISCRVDEVEPILFNEMKASGLYFVYLGIESGTDQGLRNLNKGTTVRNNLHAVATLKKLGFIFGYGFMLFEPESTFDSVLKNISFLKNIVGDGTASVVYCKMLPYAGTSIEEKLLLDSRLKGSNAQPNYDFKSTKLNYFYRHIEQNLRCWVQGSKSVSRYIDAVWQEAAVLRRLYPQTPNLLSYELFLRKFTKETNEIILCYLEVSAKKIMKGNVVRPRQEIMQNRANQQIQKLLEKRNNYILDNQHYLDS